MTCMILIYTAVMWSVIILAPEFLIGIFSSDKELLVECSRSIEVVFCSVYIYGSAIYWTDGI